MATKTNLVPHLQSDGYTFTVAYVRGAWRVFVRMMPLDKWEPALMGVETTERAALERLYRRRGHDYCPLSPEMEAVKRDLDAEESRQAEERAKAIATEHAEREANAQELAAWRAVKLSFKKLMISLKFRMADGTTETRSVPAHVLPAHGIGFSRSPKGEGFDIQHLASGLRIFRVDTMTQARTMCAAIIGVTDWTKPASEVITPEVGKEMLRRKRIVCP